MKKFTIRLLKMYKQYFSPILPPGCRFTPTCSEYMLIAIEKYGIFKGVFLGTKRIIRCNPFFKGGYDPVP